jgi:hypothetical protein
MVLGGLLLLLGLAAWILTDGPAESPLMPSQFDAGSQHEPRVELASSPHDPELESARGSETQSAVPIRGLTPEESLRLPFADWSELPQGIPKLAAKLRFRYEVFKLLRNHGCAQNVVQLAIYLREDVIGRSHSLDLPIPRDVNIKDFYISCSGPNGNRLYTFPATEYPLFWEYERLQQRPDFDRAGVLDEAKYQEVAAFVERALSLVPPP